MDEEETAGYGQPCAQCAAVDWGISDEGRFYCRSCHNVIERTRDVEDPTVVQGSSRISTISKGPRTKREGHGFAWTACEGFQFILKNQADALLRLGLGPRFKDEVLCRLWRLFLQKSGLAYVQNPKLDCSFGLKGAASDVDSSCATDGESNPPDTAGSDAGTSDWLSDVDGLSDRRSDVDGRSSVERLTCPAARRRRSWSPMSMRKTLALLHLALVWSREALPLSDLLRLVKDGFVPYVNAYELLPEEMKLFGKDALLFLTESVPSYSSVQKEAQDLVLLLDLPAPPPVALQTLLSLRYLTDANLPDDLHRWVCRLMELVGVADQTPGYGRRPLLLQYDLQTAAAIVVTMKLMFGLNDRTEWDLSSEVGLQDASDLFSFRRWFKLTQAALSRAQLRQDQDAARKQWKPKNPIIVHHKQKYLRTKRRRVSEQLQLCFEKLSSCPAGVQDVRPSTFRFCWGDEDGSDGPSLHHMKLDRVLTQTDDALTPCNASYWHPALQRCHLRHPCSPRCRFSNLQPALPRSFVWLLQLFSFLLDVESWLLFEEVLKVERQLFGPRRRRKDGSTKTRN